jgi:hypothetical protein
MAPLGGTICRERPLTGDTAHRRFSASRKQSSRSLGISHPRDSDRKGGIPVRNPYSPMAFHALFDFKTALICSVVREANEESRQVLSGDTLARIE